MQPTGKAPSRSPFRSRPGRPVAALLALALGVTGAIAVDSRPAAADYPGAFDPFAISGGFTVYAREDASLGNTETEGSVAVGGTMTKPGDGQYTLVHVVAGTGDYTLPLVDGDPTRLLVGEYSAASGGITAITSAGTSEPDLLGDLKMVQRDGPFTPFARADWLRLNTNPANVDQTPIIDATHQQFPADAAFPSGATGGHSIYTLDTSATAVADYVEANREASYAQAAQCFADLADPTAGVGYPVEVAEDYGDRVVLAPLSADRPNVVDYAGIAGTALIQFSTGPEPGVANPLIIRVPAGTTEVVGARTDPQGAYSPYIVWDLSAVTGDVTVAAAQGRIDGSIYAPEANVTVDAAPLDGQVLGRNVTTRGGEIHSFLFAGQLSCDDAQGTFRIRKAIDGIAPGDPALEGLVFTVDYVATLPDSSQETGTLTLPADGSWVGAGADFPEGTEVAFTELTPPTVPGYEWESPPLIAPNPLTIGAGATADVTVTNTATQPVGTFSVRKAIVSSDPSLPAPPPPPGSVPVTWTARYGGEQIASGTIDVPLDGTVVTPSESFPVGTLVLFSEDLSAVTPPPGYRWASAGWDPGRLVVIRDEGTTAITLTNVVAPDTSARTVTIVKEVDGVGDDPRFEYAVSYNVDPATPGGDERTTRQIEVGEPVTLTDLEAGTETLKLAELIPLFDSSPVDVDAWDAPVFEVTADGSTQTYPAGGFEGAVPLADAIVDIPLPATGDVVVHARNARKTGTFSLAKALTGVTADDLPDGTGFTVTWTATDPEGTESTGALRLPVDGTPVSPRDESGDARQFPYGTTVTFVEAAPPKIDGIVWEDAVFTPDEIVVGAGGVATAAVVVTNAAARSSATFLVAKEVVGLDPAQLTVDTVTVGYLAVPPGGIPATGSFAIPVDGTPAGPTTSTGAPREFPVGTQVLLAELPLGDAALPPYYEWAGSTWSPSRWLTVGDDAAGPATVTVTNTAVEYAGVALTKEVVGDAAPADTVFTVDWWLDGTPQTPLELTAGQTVSSAHFPVGSIIEATETLPATPAGAWQAPLWSLDGEPLPVGANGRIVVPVSSRGDDVIALRLVNALAPATPPDPLAATGGRFSPLLPFAALGAIAVGGALYAASRRRRG